MKFQHLVAVLGLAFVTAACSEGEAAPEAAVAEEVSTATSAPAAEPAAADVPATGNVIEVKMVTDSKGNYFEPAEINAKPGDVVRFVLVSGVHNVSFPAAENAGLSDLPEASPYLQIAGQTFDLKVDMPAGTYTFQCDPHVALGMIGTLTVQ